MANADNAESNGNGSASVGVGADNGNSINNATSPVSTGAYATNLNTDSGSGDVVSASSLPQTDNSTDSQSIKTVRTILLAESFASLGLTIKRKKSNF